MINMRQLAVRKKPDVPKWSDFGRAEAAAFIVTSILTSLGYTLALSNSILVPSQSVCFLDYLSDSLRMAFILLEDKKL